MKRNQPKTVSCLFAIFLTVTASGLESLIPVLIPSISIGIGGGKHREREWERR